jgi:N-acetylmuramic acid 6-phosphate etherase
MERPTGKRGQPGGPQSAGGTSAAGTSAASTEARNPKAQKLSGMSTRQILELMNDEDATVPGAVRRAIPSIERAVDIIVASLSKGGRLRYIGAGTSGRLGVLDASEMPPTFGVEPELVTGIIAGGDHALRMSIEGAEDQADAGTRDLSLASRAGDVVVGISASGRAPYVVAAVEKAKAELGAASTIGLTCNPDSPLARAADVAIVIEVGPEVIAGSSRMKAGTATKLVLNMLSTTSMVKLGRTRDDLMVDLRPTNEKLRQRAIQMVEREAKVTPEEAERRLKTWGWHVRAAIEDRWPAS